MHIMHTLAYTAEPSTMYVHTVEKVCTKWVYESGDSCVGREGVASSLPEPQPYPLYTIQARSGRFSSSITTVLK